MVIRGKSLRVIVLIMILGALCCGVGYIAWYIIWWTHFAPGPSRYVRTKIYIETFDTVVLSKEKPESPEYQLRLLKIDWEKREATIERWLNEQDTETITLKEGESYPGMRLSKVEPNRVEIIVPQPGPTKVIRGRPLRELFRLPW